MRKLILALILVTTSVFAQQQPSYLKDAVITVTLKSGKQYNYSANEYAVIKRNNSKQLVAELEKVPVYSADNKGGVVESGHATRQVQKYDKRLKHIISGEVVRSNGTPDSSQSGNTIRLKTEKQFGVGLMYQYNIHKDLFLGGRIDTNGGTGVNLGVGF